MSRILSTGGGEVVCQTRQTPPGQTRQTPSWADTPLDRLGRPPRKTPFGQTPPGRHPLPRHPPADGYCSGRYASYWNAFLFQFSLSFFCIILINGRHPQTNSLKVSLVHLLSLNRVFSLSILNFYSQFLCTEKVTKTVQIEKKYMEIEERGVKLRLTIVDTPGFNDSVNEVEW